MLIFKVVVHESLLPKEGCGTDVSKAIVIEPTFDATSTDVLTAEQLRVAVRNIIKRNMWGELLWCSNCMNMTKQNWSPNAELWRCHTCDYLVD